MLNTIGTDMLKRRRLSWWIPSLLAGLALASTALAGPGHDAAEVEAAKHPARTTYRVINLGAGDPIAVAINARGQVAFSLSIDLTSPVHAMFYDGRTIRDIGTLGDAFARITGLNNSGQIAGVSRTLGGNIRSFIWSRTLGMIDMGTVPGANQTWEPVINNHGVMSGYSTGDPLPVSHAFRWTLAAGMEDLGGFLAGADAISYGRAINDDGLVAGNSLQAGPAHHAFAWTRATGLVDIDTLGNRYSDSVAVGARGQVAGNFFVGGGHGRGFIWTRATGMRDIGTAGHDDAWVVGMSSSGRVVGVVTSDGTYQQAMTWTQASGILDLGTLGGNFSNALAANNNGQVVGATAISDTEVRAFVWTAREGMVDLNTRLRHAPAGLTLHVGHAISDNGSIVASSNAGLVLLVPVCGCSSPHSAGPIAASELVKVGTPFDASVSFAGENPAAKHHVTWTWGDKSGERAGNTIAQKGAGNATGSHTYKAPGLYTVTAKVTDLAGNISTVSRKIIAYDSSSGFAGGTGAFISPHMPNKKAHFQGGLATFSFVAPSMTNAKAISERGQLHFNVGGLTFQSRDVKAVQMQGKQAQFEGNGQINGVGNYQFSMAATAAAAADKAAPGQFSLKIWRTDPATGAQKVEYDSAGMMAKTAGRNIVAGTIAIQ
jgi:probable HAF family extracellular repeat protein